MPPKMIALFVNTVQQASQSMVIATNMKLFCMASLFISFATFENHSFDWKIQNISIFIAHKMKSTIYINIYGPQNKSQQLSDGTDLMKNGTI